MKAEGRRGRQEENWKGTIRQRTKGQRKNGKKRQKRGKKRLTTKKEKCKKRKVEEDGIR